MEDWVDKIEKLFEDLFVEEHERVPLAAHCLDILMCIWWKGVRPDRTANASFPYWAAFKENLFDAYFLDSIKQKLEDDLMNI